MVARRRTDIQVLRGLAVLGVMLFHAAEPAFPNGYLGVDAFFVISGFVVTPLMVSLLQSSANGEPLRHLGRFIDRRIRRLTPAFGTMLLGACLLLLLFMPVGGEQADTAKLGLSAIVLGANLGAYAFAGDYFQHSPNPLIHTWSLSVEEQIYLLLPLILVWTSARRRGEPIRLVTTVLLALGATSLVGTILLAVEPAPLSTIGVAEPHAGSFLFYATTSRVWEFALGGLAVLAARGIAMPAGLRARVAGAASIALGALLFLPRDLVWPFPLAEGGAALLTALALCLASGDSGHWTRPLQWLGDRSYSIYLWHMPLIVVAQHSPVLSDRRGGTVETSLALVATLVAGAASFRWIEERYRVGANGARSHPAMVRLILVFAVLPGLALAFVGLANSRHFWGVNGHHAPLPLAWNIDGACKTMNHEAFVPCWYGEPQGPVALLVGDSHAAALSQSFVEIARDAGLRAGVLTRSFCPVIDEAILNEAGRARLAVFVDEGCRRHNRAIFEALQSQVDVLVVTSRSSAGYGYLLGPGGDEFFRSVTEASLQRLRGRVGDLVIVGPVAEFPDVNFGQALLQTKAVRPLAISALPRQPFEEDCRWREFAAAENARYISAIGAVCDGSHCSYRDYLDMTHLNLNGARLLEPDLRAALVRP